MSSMPPTPTLTDLKVQVEVADRACTWARWFDAPRERVWSAQERLESLVAA